jgi:hypothetical protein
LTAAGLKALRDEYARSREPARKLAAEAVNLEHEISDLVNAAYGLTPDEIALLWATAPHADLRAEAGGTVEIGQPKRQWRPARLSRGWYQAANGRIIEDVQFRKVRTLNVRRRLGEIAPELTGGLPEASEGS